MFPLHVSCSRQIVTRLKSLYKQLTEVVNTPEIPLQTVNRTRSWYSNHDELCATATERIFETRGIVSQSLDFLHIHSPLSCILSLKVYADSRDLVAAEKSLAVWAGQLHISFSNRCRTTVLNLLLHIFDLNLVVCVYHTYLQTDSKFFT